MTDGIGNCGTICIVGRDDISTCFAGLDVDSWVRLPVIFQRFSSKIGPFNGYFSTILAFLGAVVCFWTWFVCCFFITSILRVTSFTSLPPSYLYMCFYNDFTLINFLKKVVKVVIDGNI